MNQLRKVSPGTKERESQNNNKMNKNSNKALLKLINRDLESFQNLQHQEISPQFSSRQNVKNKLIAQQQIRNNFPLNDEHISISQNPLRLQNKHQLTNNLNQNAVTHEQLVNQISQNQKSIIATSQNHSSSVISQISQENCNQGAKSNLQLNQSKSFVAHNTKLFQEALDKLQKLENKTLLSNQHDLKQLIDDKDLLKLFSKANHNQINNPSIIASSKSQNQLLNQQLDNSKFDGQIRQQIDSIKVSANSQRSLNKSTISSSGKKSTKTKQNLNQKQQHHAVSPFQQKLVKSKVHSKNLIIKKTEKLLKRQFNKDLNLSGEQIVQDIQSKSDDEQEIRNSQIQDKLIKKYSKILQIDDIAQNLFNENPKQLNQSQIIDKHKINNKVPYSTILTGKTLQDHLKGLSPEKIGLKLKSLNQSQSPCVEDMVGNHSKSTKYEFKDVLSDTSQDIKNMAYQMSQRQLLQQQNLVQPGPFYERQIPSSFVNALNPNSIFQTQQQKLKTATSQTRGTQQPQQIQHKMSQKRLADELKQLNRKADNNLVNNGGGANQNALNNSNQNISNAEIQNLSAKLQNQLPITSLGRNSQQGIYQNMQIRTTPGIYNNIQSKTHYNNGFQGLNASGYLGYNLDKSLMMSSNGYQQMNQNTTLGFINNKNGLNISSQSIERPTSQQSNANQRKNQSFLTPQRQAKLHEITKGKKLILKPSQIQKNQQSPQSQYLLNHAQAGVSNLTAKDKVLMDKKTYEELMNYLVKVECKRIERDKNQSNHYQNQNLQSNVQLIGKRPNSTLKRLAAGVPGGNLERLSHNPKPFNQNRDLMFNPLQNNFNNSSFLSAAPTSLGRNSKLSKTPQKKLLQPQKLKNIIQQNNQAQLSSEDRGINQSSSLRQIKRNNYVNELTSAYNHQTEILNKSSVTPGQQPGQVSSFFNVNQSQSIPTSKKGTQKKIILQDTMVQEYQQMTQPKLQQLLQSGKFSQYKNAMINPQNVYMTDKIQSARGAFKGTGKELINVSAPSKISNLLMHKDKQIKIGAPTIQNNIGILQPESKMPMSQRDNSVGSKQASSRQNQNNQNMIIIHQEPQQKLNKAQEVSLVKRLTSAKSKKDPKDKNQLNDLEEKSIDQNTIELDSQRRQNIQLDSDLLYGSKVAKNNNLHVILKDQITGNDVYVIDHSDHKNFDTFGDSEKNKKVTAVSELHSPDHNARSPKNPQQHQSKQLQPNIRSSIPHKLENDPYQNQSYVEQEFHYSGSFGVPMTLQNQSYQIDANNKLVQSYINQGQNLSFSIVGQNDMSIISQEQLQSNHHAYIDNKGAIIIEDNENEYISKEHNEYDDNDEEVQQIIDQPFYLQDYQEEYFETDKLSEPLKSTLSPQSKDSVNKNDLSSIDNSTVEAVKKKLINDPDYRRELLERVLPQFSKLNEQFTNSFLYRLKYSNETSSLNSNSIQKSNQSTQRQTQKVLQQTQSQQSLNTKTSQPQQFLNFQDNLVHQNDFEFNDIHTFDQRRGTDVAIISSQNLSNEGAAYELLQKINLNFNRGNLNTISSSQRRDGELDRNSTTQNMQDFLMDTDGNLLLIEQICDDDETNTVIENECENDYTDIYQSIGEDDFETEELRKKREFEYQKMQLKREIMMVAGSSNQNQKFLHVMVRRNS